MFIFKKPEYYQYFSNIVRRLKNRKLKGILTTNTIFGKPIEIDAADAIGKSILYTGIYDLALSEILWLLAAKGNKCLDIGANIGYTTMLMAEKVGDDGCIISFEPNPNLITRLKSNLHSLLIKGNVILYEFALSDNNGEAFLNLPEKALHNDGTANIVAQLTDHAVPIKLQILDDVLHSNTIIDLLKIDVEGHELNVFKGAANLLQAKKIKHIVFEENDSYPSEVSKLLINYGYTIYRIQKGWIGIELKDPLSPIPTDAYYEAINYLATLDNEEVQRKLNKVTRYSILN